LAAIAILEGKPDVFEETIDHPVGGSRRGAKIVHLHKALHESLGLESEVVGLEICEIVARDGKIRGSRLSYCGDLPGKR
jgi:hypothetical protein